MFTQTSEYGGATSHHSVRLGTFCGYTHGFIKDV
jgi:hypothetical protein